MLTHTLSNMLFLLRPYWKYGKLYILGTAVIALLIAPALALIDVSIIQSVIDAISAGRPLAATLRIGLFLIAMKLCLQLLQWSFLLLYDRWKVVDMQIKINKSTYEQALRTDYKYFDNPEFFNNFTWASSEYATRVSDSKQLISQICSAVTSSIALSAFIATLGPWVILITLIGIVLNTYAQTRISRLGVALRQESMPFDRRMSYFHRIAYQNHYAADLKSSGVVPLLFNSFDNAGAGKVDVYRKYAPRNLRANLLLFSSIAFADMATLAYLIFSVYSGAIVGVGAIAGLFAASIQLQRQLGNIFTVSNRALELSLYADKIRAFFEAKSEIEVSTGDRMPDGALSLELHDVNFAYPNSAFALRDITMSIRAGEKIAIVGENGAGKSTLAKLLLRLYDVDNGKILYDDKDVRQYDIRALRTKVGIAFQTSNVYALTLAENMQVYNTADLNKLHDILASVRLKDYGLNREVTKEFDRGGIMLSGGEAQKLALARLLTGALGLILLDEPSSALDPLAEYEMNKLMFTRASGATTIMIAHRLSTVRDADRIYLIDDGTIAEQGTHDELMSIGGKYAEMFTKQAENYVR